MPAKVLDIQIFVAGNSSFYVRIDDDVYEMSENADQPNGLCLYVGDFRSMSNRGIFDDLERRREMSIGMARAIVRIALRDAIEKPKDSTRV